MWLFFNERYPRFDISKAEPDIISGFLQRIWQNKTWTTMLAALWDCRWVLGKLTSISIFFHKPDKLKQFYDCGYPFSMHQLLLWNVNVSQFMATFGSCWISGMMKPKDHHCHLYSHAASIAPPLQKKLYSTPVQQD